MLHLLLGKTSSVSWNLTPSSHSNPSAAGQPESGLGKPYAPFGHFAFLIIWPEAARYTNSLLIVVFTLELSHSDRRQTYTFCTLQQEAFSFKHES